MVTIQSCLIKRDLFELMDNGKWKMQNAFVCRLTSFSILHFPFSIQPYNFQFFMAD